MIKCFSCLYIASCSISSRLVHYTAIFWLLSHPEGSVLIANLPLNPGIKYLNRQTAFSKHFFLAIQNSSSISIWKFFVCLYSLSFVQAFRCLTFDKNRKLTICLQLFPPPRNWKIFSFSFISGAQKFPLILSLLKSHIQISKTRAPRSFPLRRGGAGKVANSNSSGCSCILLSLWKVLPRESWFLRLCAVYISKWTDNKTDSSDSTT